MNSTKYFCQNCKKELSKDQKPCPFCGCEKRDIKVTISDTLKVKESLRGRQKRKGFKKFMMEFLQGWFPSGDKNRHPEGIEKVRIVNKENPNKEDSYQEIVKDAKSGEIVRNVKEPLSQHKHQ